MLDQIKMVQQFKEHSEEQMELIKREYETENQQLKQANSFNPKYLTVSISTEKSTIDGRL